MSDQEDDRTHTHVVLTKGLMVSHYRILGKIGAGGMGEVYLAEDTKLNREVALKFLPAHLINSDDIRTRFHREAQAIAKLNHPNIVTVHDVGAFNGRPYFVMEHVEGQTLHHFAHDEPLPVDQIIEYATQICQGLGEAHRAGIVHRDIKAQNIIIDTSGRARLLDFGLAAIEGDDKLTKTGSTLGTVSYMSPEQVSGREIDHRSDLFSLGSVLYELIAGRTPFRRDNEGATLRAIMEDVPEPLARYRSNLPDKLQDMISQLLDKNKEMRYQSAEGVIADLKRLVYDSQQSAYGRALPAPQRKKGLLIGLGAVAAVTVIGLASYFYFGTQTNGEASDTVPMIAVLPFENLGSAADEYFADGITEEITSRLAGIKGLGVISRTSSMKYKDTDKNLKQIGRELGVNFILEGTVRWSKVGDQAKVRITPQLVDVSDDRHLWADNYERALLEVFEVQADIAAKIVDQLGIALLEQDRQEMANLLTENPRAYEFYLKGLNAMRVTDWDNLQMTTTARVSLDSAVALDPKFAHAYAARSRVYSWLSFANKYSENAKIALASARRALELRPGLPLGHQALGIYYNIVETDYTRALEEFNSARSELHNDPDLLSSIALVQMRQGLFYDSRTNSRKAVALDPLNPDRYYDLAICLRFSREYDEAEEAIDRAIALDPSRALFYRTRIELCVTRYGDWDKVQPLIEEALGKTDTVEFLTAGMAFYDRMPDLPWRRSLETFSTELRGRMEADQLYAGLAHGYYELHDTVNFRLYADSARMAVEEKLAEFPDDPHRLSAMGLIYAALGDCDRAIEDGRRGKELLSVGECHW